VLLYLYWTQDVKGSSEYESVAIIVADLCSNPDYMFVCQTIETHQHKPKIQAQHVYLAHSRGPWDLNAELGSGGVFDSLKKNIFGTLWQQADLLSSSRQVLSFI